MSNGKPQRRTLVKVLNDLVMRVNADVLITAQVGDLSRRYRNLLLAANAAERVLDRERQHERKEAIRQFEDRA
jgi:superfamily II DNA or RNA helicase